MDVILKILVISGVLLWIWFIVVAVLFLYWKFGKLDTIEENKNDIEKLDEDEFY